MSFLRKILRPPAERLRPLPLLAIFAMLVASCKYTPQPGLNNSARPSEGEEAKIGSLVLKSFEIPEGGPLSKRHTCDGENVSPPLKIEGIPEGTESFTLIVEDPDAPEGNWVHWLVWNISPQFDEIPEGSVPPSAIQGTNDFGYEGWGGPCPPPGRAHRYVFKLYALDNLTELRKGERKPVLEKVMEGHILAQAELVGTYERGR